MIALRDFPRADRRTCTPGRVAGASSVGAFHFKLSVGVTSHAYLLEIDGIFTQGSRPGRTLGESVGGMFETDSSDWSNWIRTMIRYQTRH